MNAELGQYQSFALIAFSALRIQSDRTAICRFRGSDVSEQIGVLFLAEQVVQTVFNYSIQELSSVEITENDVIAMCDWLKSTLLFSCDEIPDLEPTYLNGSYDFDPDDFSFENPDDFN